MTNFDSVDELRDILTDGDALQVVSLQSLRQAIGYKKLGPLVLETVGQKLAGQGIGYFPPEVIDDNDLPRGWQEVRVFLTDSPLGKTVKAILDPTESGDRRLMELAEGDSATADKLEQIRAILEG